MKKLAVWILENGSRRTGFFGRFLETVPDGQDTR